MAIINKKEEKRNKTQKLKVLVGDDQIGEIGSLLYYNFIESYGDLADYDFTTKSNEFIDMARKGSYAALLIDLRWGPEFPTEGYRVLRETRFCSPVRILHTGENREARELGYLYGATDCVSKGVSPENLEKILRGREN